MSSKALWWWLGVLAFGVFVTVLPVIVALVMSAAAGFQTDGSNRPDYALFYLFFSVPLGAPIALAGLVGFLITVFSRGNRGQ